MLSLGFGLALGAYWGWFSAVRKNLFVGLACAGGAVSMFIFKSTFMPFFERVAQDGFNFGRFAELTKTAFYDLSIDTQNAVFLGIIMFCLTHIGVWLSLKFAREPKSESMTAKKYRVFKQFGFDGH